MLKPFLVSSGSAAVHLRRCITSRSTAILLSACFVLGWAIYFELEYVTASRTAAPLTIPKQISAIDVDASLVDTSFQLTPVSEFRAIMARPLFAPSRRPISEEIAPAPDQIMPATNLLRLRGVAVIGTRKVALVEHRETGELLPFAEGQSIGGWRIISIRPQAISIAQGGVHYELYLPVGTELFSAGG